ncbi:beta-1,3-galactosyltransferase 14 [Populus alba x Populus x berolinensis]|uniref:Hexosyltransferase n=1 Tax=Populus alba x Populus x berolinensis TaxID=444605 RepID=A0AAD6WIX1_9ROSI|nr:beta-1,3-galactosyltransferase 14 [Populus alba x Populus x berolinensis]
MPSSPKFFHSRLSQPSNSRRSTVLILSCLLIGISGFIFGLTSFLTCSRTYRCFNNSPPRTVRVVWGTNSNKNDNGVGNALLLDGEERRERQKVMGFVGIQTGFGSTGRRQSLRKTWMPSDRQGLQRLEESTGLAFRFVIGRTNDKSKTAELKREIAEYDDFLLLDIEEQYSQLPYKTLAFFKAAYALFDSEFYVKADDDIYLRPDRLSTLLAKERAHSQTYLGCLKKGPQCCCSWSCCCEKYEPLSYLLGTEYFLHAYGPIYALSADVVASLVALRDNSFRMFSNEDVTIGAWILAMNVNHEDNRALCSPECTPSSIAVWDIPKCSGLCNPEARLLELHQQESCSKNPTMESDD